jgi:hypothetical protein
MYIVSKHWWRTGWPKDLLNELKKQYTYTYIYVYIYTHINNSRYMLHCIGAE